MKQDERKKNALIGFGTLEFESLVLDVGLEMGSEVQVEKNRKVSQEV